MDESTGFYEKTEVTYDYVLEKSMGQYNRIKVPVNNTLVMKSQGLTQPCSQQTQSPTKQISPKYDDPTGRCIGTQCNSSQQTQSPRNQTSPKSGQETSQVPELVKYASDCP